MAMRFLSGVQIAPPLPKKTRQGQSQNTKYSATARNRKKKPYRGQGR